MRSAESSSVKDSRLWSSAASRSPRSEPVSAGAEKLVALPAADRLDHHFGLTGPVTVDGGLAGTGTFGQRIHAHAVVPDLHQELEGGVEDGLAPGGTRTGGAPLRLDELCFGDDHGVLSRVERNRSVPIIVGVEVTKRNRSVPIRANCLVKEPHRRVVRPGCPDIGAPDAAGQLPGGGRL